MAQDPVSRRAFLRDGAVLGAGLALGGTAFGRIGDDRGPQRWRHVRQPGSRPHPKLPEGVDTLPQIEHVIVVMMENHSYDNYLGMLRRGDGFRLDDDGRPRVALPDGNGNLVRAFHMPSTCQLNAVPSQAWNASHISLGHGNNDGFVRACGPVAMGYWTADDIPFYYALARHFPVCDRWFGSCLAQTYPNRRFLFAGTAAGIVSTTNAALLAPPPPNGTIFERLDAHGISWHDYASDLPQLAILASTYGRYSSHVATIDRFYSDAKAGTLPFLSLVDPPFSSDGSEENPQDIRIGEAFVAKVVNAVLESPAWPKTVIIWCYDEHGGYYDHVVPPRAIAPDSIPPDIHVPPDRPGGYDRYGFRVPAVVVSPFARKHYVSHVVHDHTSILKLVETKWNLPALTFRDANADNLLDSLDLDARPAFLEPPDLPAPGLAASGGASICTAGHPGGAIPPAWALTPA
jgi:phospholipase C